MVLTCLFALNQPLCDRRTAKIGSKIALLALCDAEIMPDRELWGHFRSAATLISPARGGVRAGARAGRARSEEHTSELQSLMRISYAVFCLKKKNTTEKEDNNSKMNQHHTS